MKRSSAATLIVLLLIIIFAGGFYFLTKNNTNTAPPASNSTGSSSSHTKSTTQSGSQSAASNQAGAEMVTISNFSFSPANLTIKPGMAVTWSNKDSTAHTVTENDGQGGPNSGTLDPGASYTFTFSKAGTYHYRCNFHAEMVGTVTVS